MTIIGRVASVFITAFSSVAIAATPPFPHAPIVQRFVSPPHHDYHPHFRP